MFDKCLLFNHPKPIDVCVDEITRFEDVVSRTDQRKVAVLFHTSDPLDNAHHHEDLANPPPPVIDGKSVKKKGKKKNKQGNKTASGV